MSARDDALRLTADLPADATWDDVARAVQWRSDRAAGRPMVLRELQVPYGSGMQPERAKEEEAVGNDYDVVIERDAEGWFVGSVPALRGCHTQARTVEQLLERVREAVALSLEGSGGRPGDTGFVGVRRVSVAG